ncbi:inorganic phosphate transporter [Snodgrassella alvi]|uniref:Phosphate transporter n=1 Tax=Snodgrassella alvi TaxID=1196083 RepID=A0A2N9XXB2_9NEIS|nr:inorganic phosphate transporter [Snodgrassella alvi]PIT54519.1 nuclease PIN [Snodgrassella alvi]
MSASGKTGKVSKILFLLILLGGLAYAGVCIYHDLQGVPSSSLLVYALLTVALLIALAFEFVNGFHDTANAVASVIYTHSLKPNTAVIWSGVFNFLGVMLSTGAVAYGIVSLLPVELILHMGSDVGYAMIFALLCAAIIWNLSTWWLGLPASSSHTLIGSIIGVGVANQLMSAHQNTSGVSWRQVINVGESLLFSPLLGFVLAALLLILSKKLLRIPALYKAPENDAPPPWPIRLLLIFTCTTVSFAHGSNDGQKGMGLIMLILIGTVPMAYALNHAVPKEEWAKFSANSLAAQKTIEDLLPPGLVLHTDTDARAKVMALVEDKQGTPEQLAALGQLIQIVKHDVSKSASLRNLPPEQVGNIRNDMYLVSESLTLLQKNILHRQYNLNAVQLDRLNAYHISIDHATKYIPAWVKVLVALALGLGTLVGWRRIVVTVGEKIGKTHLSYAQGASAELVTASLIFAADRFGLPVSTTHVLTSGIAGAMSANKSGLQKSTIRNLVIAWVLTLPVSVVLAGGLFWFFRMIF